MVLKKTTMRTTKGVIKCSKPGGNAMVLMSILQKALKKHEYTATFEKYCLKKHDPPAGKPEELRKFPSRLFF